MAQQALSSQMRRELCLELLDQARAGKGDKLQLLLQVEELVLRRDVSLVGEIVPEVLELSQDRSVDIRKFLVELAGSSLDKSLSILPAALNLFNHLVTDSNELVLTRMSLELRRSYDKMVMNIVNIPLKTKQSAQQADPKQMWQHLRTVTNRLVDVISSDRGERVRDASLSLAESVVIFGLPAPPVTHDPRLKRSAIKDAGGGAGLSVEDVPLHHAFINRNELEQEAEDIFKKMLLWTTRGGPQGFPFTPNQMSILGQGIARIASQRPRSVAGSSDEEGRGSMAAKALVFMLTGKNNVCKDMRGSSREALAKATNALLRSPFSSMPDPQGLVAKLRGALSTLEALGFEDAPEPSGKKRPASEMESGGGAAGSGDGDEDVEQDKKRRADAVSVLDAAEELIRTKTLHGDEAAVVGGLAAEGALGSASHLQKNDTELAADIAVPFELSVSSRGSLASVTQKSSATGNSEVVMRLLPPTADATGDLAMSTLQRLLDSYYDIKAFNEKALVSHAKLTARMAVSMALVDVANGRLQATVPLVVTLPSGCNPRLTEGVPMELQLPRALWQLISFVLSPPNESDDKQAVSAPSSSSTSKLPQTLAAAVRDKMIVVVCLLEDLRERADDEMAAAAGDEQVAAPGSRPCSALYETVCTVVLARLLQNLNLRELAKPLLTSLAWVPRPCLSLLKLLMHTGTKATAAPNQPLARQGAKGRQAPEVRNRGTRMESLTLLTHLVFAVDEEAGAAALNHLLWCSLSEEFETRSKAVTLLINDVLPGGDWVLEIVSSFAVQAAGTLVGAEAALQGEEAAEAVRRQKWELPSELKAAADKEAAERAAKEAAGAMDVDGEGGGGGEGEGKEGVKEAETTASADETMAVDVEADAAGTPALTLARAMSTYDGGAAFDGSFSSVPSASKEKFEAHVRRSIQLLMQLCTSQPALLGVVMDLAGAAARSYCPDGVYEDPAPAPPAPAPAAAPPAVEGAAETPASSESAPVPAPITTPTADAVFGPRQMLRALHDILKAELGKILPAIAQAAQASEVVFSHLARSDPLAAPLLEHALGVLTGDMHTAPSARLLETVQVFWQLSANADNQALKLRYSVSLLGGMSAAEVRELLPRVLGTFIGDADALNIAFSRIVMARPPALTKSSLLVAMHRIDPEAHAMAPKVVYESIGLCLARDDFKNDIKECLQELLKDELPCLLLMRTAIVASMNNKDVCKFVLSEAIPTLLRKQIWTNAKCKSVWEGVCHFVKRFAAAKDAEQTLRCLLGLPSAPLKLLLKLAPNARAPVGKTLKALSANEKEEVLSGRWAGIDVSSRAGEPAKLDADKQKLVKECLAEAATAK